MVDEDYRFLRAGTGLSGPPLYHLFDRLRNTNPVWESPWGDWYVSSYEGVVSVLRSNICLQSELKERESMNQVQCAQSNPLMHLADWIMFKNPPVHKDQRRLLARMMAGHTSDAIAAYISGAINELLNQLPESDFDFVEMVAKPLPVAVICEIAQIPPSDRSKIANWGTIFRDVLDVGADMLDVAKRNEIEAAHRYFYALADNKEWLGRAFGGKASAVQGEMTRAELANNILFLVFSGHETTVHLLGSMLLELVQDNAVWDDLIAGRIDRAKVIDEALRLHSPIQKLCRVNTDDILIDGMAIPKNSNIVLLLGAANRDPKVFKNPEKITSSHPSKKHLAFGLGTHFCLGTSLALLEADVMLEALVRRCKFHSTVNKVTWIDNSSFKGLASLEITA
jgi:cytochrome P450